MHTAFGDDALRAWVQGPLTSWAYALLDGHNPSRAWTVLEWKRQPGGVDLATPVHYARNTDGGQPTTRVGTSAHVRMAVGQHHDGVVDGFAKLIDHLLPSLPADIDQGWFKITWEEGQLHLLLSVNAHGQHYSSCTLVKKGCPALALVDVAGQLGQQSFYILPD
jgi:hypothetical protein